LRTLIHQIIEERARASPTATAVIFYSERLTYRELNAAANQLARHLKAASVKPGDAVCVLLEPSTDCLVALLALLKLGAVYVPLDPGHPAERLKVIVEDVRPVTVLTSEILARSVAAPLGYLTPMEEFRRQRSRYAGDNLDLPVQGDQIAYIFYTSGTTGKPKGVLATHDNLVFYVQSALKAYSMGPHVVMPTMARFTFSISLFELLCPLAAGGAVTVLTREHILDLPNLAKTLEQVTMVHMGPSLLKKLVAFIRDEYPSFKPFQGMFHISSGGDHVRAELQEALKSVFTTAEVFVIYGGSELSCMGTTYRVPRDAAVERSLVGKPFPGVSLRLVDAQDREVPPGEIGEICFAGPGITRGYLNLPELTAEKYRPLDGERYYHTGDLGRCDEQGNVEFLGRADFQVKVRGARVELAEVESYLTRIPGIREAVAASVDMRGDEPSLAAYLVMDPQNPATFATIKTYLEAHLPDYSIPSLYVVLDKLPLNHNFKLDRKALPRPSSENLLNSGELDDPNTPVEAELVKIWSKALHIDRIGTRQSFFDLGGDSLLAVRIIMDIERDFGRRIPITLFLAAPTIRQVADLLTGTGEPPTDEDLFVIKRGDARPALFLIHGALIYKDLADHLPPGQTVCVLYSTEEAHLIGLRKIQDFMKVYPSIEAMANRYLLSLRAFQPKGPYHIAGFSIGGLIALEMARTLIEQGEVVSDVTLVDCFVPSFVRRSPIRKFALHLRILRSRGLPHLAILLRAAHAKFWATRSLGSNTSSGSILDSHARTEELRRLARAQAVSTYVARPFTQKVVLFKGSEWAKQGETDRSLGWSETIGQLEIHDVEGIHLDLLKGESARKIARRITELLESPDQG
jgi:amino acid adenylation domain-containing protein